MRYIFSAKIISGNEKLREGKEYVGNNSIRSLSEYLRDISGLDCDESKVIINFYCNGDLVYCCKYDLNKSSGLINHLFKMSSEVKNTEDAYKVKTLIYMIFGILEPNAERVQYVLNNRDHEIINSIIELNNSHVENDSLWFLLKDYKITFSKDNEVFSSVFISGKLYTIINKNYILITRKFLENYKIIIDEESDNCGQEGV